MNDKPLVSVIIIFLNEEKFIQEAIDSVFSQTYDNWELLLVDDGSTDKSTEIARSYTGQHTGKVHFLEHAGHQNQGMSASRNLGVRNAKGKYVSYLDGDDVWLPHKLEQQVAILESRPEAVMVHGPLLEWYSWTGNPEDMHRDHLYGVGEDGVHPYADTLVKPPKLLALFLHKEDFIPSGVLVLREVIEQVGGSEETFCDSFEDAVVNVKICLKFTVFVSGQSWYKYRIHPDSCERTAIKAKQANTKLLRYLNWVENYLSEQGVKDPEIWQALQNALWSYHHPRLHRLLECYRSIIRQIEKPILHIGRWTLSVSLRNWLWDRWLRCRKNLIN